MYESKGKRVENRYLDAQGGCLAKSEEITVNALIPETIALDDIDTLFNAEVKEI